MLNWKNVKRLVIPDGVVHTITRNGMIIWGRFVSLRLVLFKCVQRFVAKLSTASVGRLRAKWRTRIRSLGRMAVGGATVRTRLWVGGLRDAISAVTLAAKVMHTRLKEYLHLSATVSTGQHNLKKGSCATVLRAVILLPSWVVWRCSSRITALLSMRQQMKTAGSSAHTKARHEVKHYARVKSGNIGKMIGWLNRIATNTKMTLRTGGQWLRETIQAAMSSKIKMSTGNDVGSCAQNSASAKSMVRGTGGKPDALTGRQMLRQHKHMAAILPTAAAPKAAKAILPIQRYVGLLNSVKTALLGGAEIHMRLAVRLTRTLFDSTAQTVCRITNAVRGLLIAKADTTTSSFTKSRFQPAASIDMMPVPESWESPVQIGDTVYITQAFTVTQTDSILMIT